MRTRRFLSSRNGLVVNVSSQVVPSPNCMKAMCPAPPDEPVVEPSLFFDYTIDIGEAYSSFAAFATHPGASIAWTANGVPFTTADVGNLPDGAAVEGTVTPGDGLQVFALDFGEFTGDLLAFTDGVESVNVDVGDGITGTLPLNWPTSLLNVAINTDGMTASALADLASVTGLVEFVLVGVPVSALAVTALPVGLVSFTMNDCTLTEAMIEELLGLMAVDIELRPEGVSIDLTGLSNANASVTALAIRDALLVEQPTWFITLNEP